MVHSFFKAFGVGVLVILFFFILHKTGLLTLPTRFFVQGISSLAVPLKENTYSFQQCIRAMSSKNQNDLALAQNTIHKLQSELVTLQGLAQENTQLRTQLHFFENNKTAYEVASVIGTLTDPQRNIISINKGAHEGIKKGMPVIVEEGVLIGTIYAVSDSVSQVMLLNDSKSKILATIPSNVGAKGIVEGNFSLGLLFTLIPIGQDVKLDSLIATSGFQEHIPKNLIIGSVFSVDKKATDLFQSATITPSVDYQNISLVSVLLTY